MATDDKNTTPPIAPPTVPPKETPETEALRKATSEMNNAIGAFRQGTSSVNAQVAGAKTLAAEAKASVDQLKTEVKDLSTDVKLIKELVTQPRPTRRTKATNPPAVGNTDATGTGAVVDQPPTTDYNAAPPVARTRAPSMQHQILTAVGELPTKITQAIAAANITPPAPAAQPAATTTDAAPAPAPPTATNVAVIQNRSWLSIGFVALLVLAAIGVTALCLSCRSQQTQVTVTTQISETVNKIADQTKLVEIAKSAVTPPVEEKKEPEKKPETVVPPIKFEEAGNADLTRTIPITPTETKVITIPTECPLIVYNFGGHPPFTHELVPSEPGEKKLILRSTESTWAGPTVPPGFCTEHLKVGSLSSSTMISIPIYRQEVDKVVVEEHSSTTTTHFRKREP